MVPMELEQALSAGSTIIGFLTWYDCRNASITPPELSKLFSKHEMLKNKDGDFVDFPDDIKPKNAFQKACRKAMMGTGESSDTRRSVTKLIVDGPDKIVYGVVDLDVNQKLEEINPDFSDRVWMDKHTLTVGYDKGHLISKSIEKIFNELCGSYTTRDISRMIVSALERRYSVSLRDAGVIYFLPNKFTEELKSLQAVVNNIGQCNMRMFAIGDGGGNISSIRQEAKAEVQDKIASMRADLTTLQESIESGALKGQVAEKSVELRLQRYEDLKLKCNILADALRIKADDLMGDLEKVGDFIKKDMLSATSF